MATKKTTTKKDNEAEMDAALMVSIPEIALKTFKLTVIGDSSLIVHAWSEKAKREMLEKQTKKPSKGKDIKNPIRDFVTAAYWMDDCGHIIDPPEVNYCETVEAEEKEYARILEIAKNAHFGFPACAFKAAAIDAAYQQGYVAKKTSLRGSFHIIEEYVEIEGTPTMREDMVRIGGISKVADIRYRPEFTDWKATMTIAYNPTSITASQIASIFEVGGFSNGVGEWRPSRNGEHGRFHVAKKGE